MSIDILGGEPPVPNEHVSKILHGQFRPSDVIFAPVGGENSVRLSIRGYQGHDQGPLATVVDTGKLRLRASVEIQPYEFVIMPYGGDISFDFDGDDQGRFVVVDKSFDSYNVLLGVDVNDSNAAQLQDYITDEGSEENLEDRFAGWLDRLEAEDIYDAIHHPASTRVAYSETQTLMRDSAPLLLRRSIFPPLDMSDAKSLAMMVAIPTLLADPSDLMKPPINYLPYRQTGPFETSTLALLFGNNTPGSVSLRRTRNG